jgi:hypothetical protein
MTGRYEHDQQDLDPNRPEEQHNARLEAEYRLRERGITVTTDDSDEETADILDAVERFEAAVERKGGDLFVNRIGSSEPEDPAFVPPEREAGETAADYRQRIEAATDRLRGR